MFIDQAQCLVRSGDGGRGVVAFRREKYVPMGGPSGGDGGRGGDVVLVGDPELATLISFQHRREFRALDGEAGGNSNRRGRDGETLRIPVPLGTVATDRESGQVLAEVLEAGQTLLVARGGQGGRGNARFASSVRQSPRFAERGEPGQQISLALELRVLADVGLLGMPNAGKSTLLAAVSAARPRIAAYPFSTLEPQLAVVRRDSREMVLADIPGLVEGAHEGRGLGNEFLRHLSRCRVLVHVVDAAGSEGRDPVEDFGIIEAELRYKSPELAARPRILAANKADLPAWEGHAPALRDAARDLAGFVGLSAAAGQGTEELVRMLLELLERQPPRLPLPGEQTEDVVVVRGGGRRRSVVREADGVWRLQDPTLERLSLMADLDNAEALDYLLAAVLRSGVDSLLRRVGVAPGDAVRLGEWTFTLGEDGKPAEWEAEPLPGEDG